LIENHFRKGGNKMAYSFELLFKKPDKKKGHLPGPPLAQVYVNTHSKDAEEHILITPQCLSFAEINYQIDRLIKELEDIRKKAKQKFTT
jgi:hypothetical protein